MAAPEIRQIEHKTILKKLGVRVSSRVGASAMQATILVILARQAGPADFAAFATALALGAAVSAAIGFGLGTFALRARALQPDEVIALESRAGRARIVTASLYLTSGSFLSYALAPGSFWPIWAGIASTFSEQLHDYAQGLLLGHNKQRFATSLLAIQRLIPLLGVASATVFTKAPAFEAFAFSSLIAGLTALSAFRVRNKPAPISRLLSQTRAYWSNTVLAGAAQLELPIAAAAMSATAAGVYSAGNRIGMPLSLVVGSLLVVIVPTLAGQTNAAIKASLRRTVRFGSAIAISLAIASPLISWTLIQTLGSSYRPGFAAYLLITCGAAVSGLSQIFQAYLYSIGRARYTASTMLLAAPVGLGAVYLLALQWGITGAAVGHFAWQLLILVSFSIPVRRWQHE